MVKKRLSSPPAASMPAAPFSCPRGQMMALQCLPAHCPPGPLLHFRTQTVPFVRDQIGSSGCNVLHPGWLLSSAATRRSAFQSGLQAKSPDRVAGSGLKPPLPEHTNGDGGGVPLGLGEGGPPCVKKSSCSWQMRLSRFVGLEVVIADTSGAKAVATRSGGQPL